VTGNRLLLIIFLAMSIVFGIRGVVSETWDVIALLSLIGLTITNGIDLLEKRWHASERASGTGDESGVVHTAPRTRLAAPIGMEPGHRDTETVPRPLRDIRLPTILPLLPLRLNPKKEYGEE
jgi:hypothetical protein